MLNRILGSLLLVTATMLSASAHADSVILCLDTAANGATLSWAGTSDQVRVGIFDGDKWTYRYKDGLSVSGCNSVEFENYDACKIYDIEVSVNGDNMVWIDQIKVFYKATFGWASQTAPLETYGADNASGWCLSSDPNDYKGNEWFCSPNESPRSRIWNGWLCF